MYRDSITYEQPLNEQFRVYLRLEHLFKQLHYHMENMSIQNSRLAIETLLKIVDVADRPDLKSKLMQTLTQQATTLGQLEQFPQVDSEKLDNILHHLDRMIDALHHHRNNKLGEPLRQNPFLNHIRRQINNPAGICNFTVPAYALWLRRPEKERAENLEAWSLEFKLLEDIVATILNLTREGTPNQQVSAQNVFYQQALDANMPCQMVRVTLPVEYNLYPEISVGKHRLSIRFKAFTTSAQTYLEPKSEEKLPFQLSCCWI